MRRHELAGIVRHVLELPPVVRVAGGGTQLRDANSRGQIAGGVELPEETGGETRGKKPIHYLLITKGEPHRRQIGRIVERINSMGTMRLIALRDYSIIRDASTHIQLRGQELDRMMRKWSRRAGGFGTGTRTSSLASREDRRRMNCRTERTTNSRAWRTALRMILSNLSAALDEVGVKAVHGLHFRINRSRYYVCEFESLLASLKIGNIDTWVSYDQFVTRGLSLRSTSSTEWAPDCSA